MLGISTFLDIFGIWFAVTFQVIAFNFITRHFSHHEFYILTFSFFLSSPTPQKALQNNKNTRVGN